MDSQSTTPLKDAHSANPQQLKPPISTVTPMAQQHKPKLAISDSAAEALLMINNLQTAQRASPKYPIKLLLAAAGLVLMVVLASILLGTFKPGGSSMSTSSGNNTGTTGQSTSNTTDNTTNQINQDVHSCANPVNAVSEC